MSENFQLHLLKCWYSQCYCNLNLTVSNSRKLRGLQNLNLFDIINYLVEERCWQNMNLKFDLQIKELLSLIARGIQGILLP